MPERIRHDDILELRMSRPPANALDPETVGALTREIRDAKAAGLRAIVLSGQPGMFSAGLDVPHLLALERPAMETFFDSFFGMLRQIAASELPICAAMTGHAPAGGTVMALFCDWRVAAAGDFKLGFNEVHVGLPVPRPVYVAFERLAGSRIAAQYCNEGRVFGPDEALAIGLVDELAPPGEVVGRALAWCRKLLAIPARQAVMTTRGYARAGLMAGFETLAVDRATFASQWFSAETQGAMQALLARLRAKR